MFLIGLAIDYIEFHYMTALMIPVIVRISARNNWGNNPKISRKIQAAVNKILCDIRSLYCNDGSDFLKRLDIVLKPAITRPVEPINTKIKYVVELFRRFDQMTILSGKPASKGMPANENIAMITLIEAKGRTEAAPFRSFKDNDLKFSLMETNASAHKAKPTRRGKNKA